MSKRVNNTRGPKTKRPPFCQFGWQPAPGKCKKVVDDAPTHTEVKRIMFKALVKGDIEVLDAMNEYTRRRHWPRAKSKLVRAGALARVKTYARGG